MFYVVVKNYEDLIRFCDDFRMPTDNEVASKPLEVDVSYFLDSDKKLDGKNLSPRTVLFNLYLDKKQSPLCTLCLEHSCTLVSS